MTKPTRFTPEKQQELISRYQFCERVVEFGWIPVPPEDLGEDFIVQVYFEGQATGVSFYVQEKSITDFHVRKKGDFLPYSFDVKDLLHWEKFVQPVVLLVWDTKLREGRWALLREVIDHIDRKRPKWRTQKTTRAYIPLSNGTGNEGLVKLRHNVGKSMFPVIGKGKELSMKMTLGSLDSWGDDEMKKAFQKFYDEGEEVTLSGNVIKSIEVPDWAKPWFGTDFVEITMGSIGSTEPLPVDITIIALNGKTETMKGVELKSIKAGMNTVQLSNEHQDYPLKFEFIFSSSRDCSAFIGLNNLGGNVNITQEILKFAQAMSVGGKLQLFSLKHNSPLPVEIPVPNQPQMEPNPKFIKLVDALCLIQAKIGQFIQLPPYEKVTKQDIQTINELLMIIEHGKLKRRMEKLEGQYKVDSINNIFENYRNNSPITFTVVHEASSGELFNQKIEMGKVIEKITGKLDMTLSELENSIAAHKAEGVLYLRLVDVESIATFSDW